MALSAALHVEHLHEQHHICGSSRDVTSFVNEFSKIGENAVLLFLRERSNFRQCHRVTALG